MNISYINSQDEDLICPNCGESIDIDQYFDPDDGINNNSYQCLSCDHIWC